MKTGMDHDGKEITGLAYLRQRIEDAFKFPRSRVPLARAYGSDFHELIDRNVDDDFIATAYEMIVDTFTDPACDLDDCTFKRMKIHSLNDRVTIDVFIIYEGDEVELKGLSYA